MSDDQPLGSIFRPSYVAEFVQRQGRLHTLGIDRFRRLAALQAGDEVQQTAHLP